MSDPRQAARAPLARSPAPPPWTWPIVLYVPLAAWHAALARDLPKLLGGLHPRGAGFAALAWACVGALVIAALVEAGFYGMLWGARGRRLPVLPGAVAILQLSLLELFAGELLARAAPGSRIAPLVALLAGARAIWRGARAPSAWAAAFGSLGALAVGRAALLASLQAYALRVRVRETMAAVALTWLGSHVAWWWLLELARGRGPQG